MATKTNRNRDLMKEIKALETKLKARGIRRKTLRALVHLDLETRAWGLRSAWMLFGGD